MRRRHDRQRTMRLSRSGASHAVLLSALACAAAQAQPDANAAGSQSFSLVPRLSATVLLTDNLRLNDAAKDRAVVTTLAPGLSLSLRSAHVRAALDYSLTGLSHLKSDQKNQTQNALNATGYADLLDRWLSVDARAQIGQQAISAFGAIGGSNALSNLNRTETALINVSPAARGRLLDLASYELRGTLSEVRAKNSLVGDASGRALSLRVDGLRGTQRGVSWYLRSQTMRNDTKQARSTTTSSSLAGLRWRPDIDWLLSASAGGERSDLASSSQTSGVTYGLDATWTPSPRTNVLASWQHHSFGDSHNFSFEHRMSRSALRMSDATSSSAPGAIGATGRMNNYDLLFLQFASIQPDPVKRDELVKATLQAYGIAADAVASPGFLSNTATLTRRQEAALSWTGLRLALTAAVSQTRSHRLGPQQGTGDDLSHTDLVRQQSISMGLSYRLTQDMSLALNGAYQRSRGDLPTQSTSLKSLVANWNARLGRLSTAQVGLRHSRFYSLTQPYRENALTVTLVQQF